MTVETLYSTASIVYSDRCFDQGLAELASIKPRGAKLAPNWRVAEARTNSQPDDRIAKVGGRVLEGVLSIPAGYVGNSQVLRYLLPAGLASEYAKKATQINRGGNWVAIREDIPNPLNALSKAIKSGIEIRPEEVRDNMVRIPLKNLGQDSRGLALYGGWNGDKATKLQRVDAHAKWLGQFKVAEKEGVRLFVPSDDTVNGVGKPVDTQFWSAGSDRGFILVGDGRYLDSDFGVFGVLD